MTTKETKTQDTVFRSGEMIDQLLSENAKVVLNKRYLRRNHKGEVDETPDGMLRRVAHAIAQPELLHGSKKDAQKAEERFFQIMSALDFVPNSPTLMNAGTGAGTLSACFVIGLDDSMNSIMTTAKEAAMVQKFGGGTGFALSTIRAKGAPIATTHGKACGPIAVLRHLSSVSTLVTQGGKRDGANMAVMDVHHPDILEFIDCKEVEGQIHNFNISVGATDEFMAAVRDGTEYELRDPETSEVTSTLDAREVFTKIINGAWRNGEPGMIFLDAVNRDNPTLNNIGPMTATNPCGEQPLLPYESCNLGSINLANFLINEGGTQTVDWARLREVIRIATQFLDNVIDANAYSVDKIEKMTKDTRKIGLGIMGFADMLMMMRIPYDSKDGVNLGRKVMKFIRDESDAMSCELAEIRGVFPAFAGSKYDAPNMPKMRNACRLTVAPTGTISMIAGCSSGCEPAFALCYHKHNILKGQDGEGQSLLYVDRTFEKVARQNNFYSDELMNYLADGGSIQEREDVPDWAKRVFVTASDISPEWHVRMQAAFQESVDSGISKTINFPNEASVDDVQTAYELAWELGCKGITVYRAGSREQEVLTAGSQDSSRTDASQAQRGKVGLNLTPRQRPSTVTGVTDRIRTGHGNMYVTVNFDDVGQPFELFTTLGKAGGCDSAQLEAISRLVSLALRSGVDPGQVVEQLRGITCDPVWEGGTLVRSTPDAVAIILDRRLEVHAQDKLPNNQTIKTVTAGEDTTVQPGLFASTFETADRAHAVRPSSGASCPECSDGLVAQEGCLRCLSCGYSKCD